ncbi:tRNA hydroxylase [Oleiphilus sp. HI0009]|uniref:tRNA-(ms[2]io[6]A)-hydroxylase n=1 Tax=unclassified Oleiphilus TaxID=2631174 RepID=UPI0007C327FA|nr:MULTISPECIES: tRNA isopentenyl-2-thiomethyl-A-37 hydroxylase MiaE [unclassified Oleiphilus]KZX79386.1 tRNA hydroxylase [Oleiphilus sp. HI0009]KZY63074.1 tRNA hydroxylase [Oleiphilus sp. HI0066]KZY69139.1 tRNA hydroxylase [Oleiphilus sp. HI0067]
MNTDALAEIHEFLGCETPDLWITNALANQDIMLIDHAHCEKKAAMTALNNIHRYPDDNELLNKMSRLAREELRHFEQVLKIIKKRGLIYGKLSASRYANGLRDQMRKTETEKLVDVLIIGAFIEARSCERFAKLAPFLDEELKDFYESLLKSEARHYQDYLKLATKYAGEDISERVAEFKVIEAALIEEPDTEFRFHSGPVH